MTRRRRNTLRLSTSHIFRALLHHQAAMISTIIGVATTRRSVRQAVKDSNSLTAPGAN